MPRNIEVKARLADRDAAVAVAAALATADRQDIWQDDTFFRCDSGRLKLRTLDEDHAELIFYQRPDEAGLSTSFYTATTTTDPGGLRDLLTLAFGAVGRVRKHRILFIADRTRIHLDRVEGLGDFAELEVPIDDPGDAGSAAIEAAQVMATLGIEPRDLISTAYVDLIRELQ